MAKGFTVKADVPKKKAKSVDEFNMDEAKALVKERQLYFAYQEEVYHISS